MLGFGVQGLGFRIQGLVFRFSFFVFRDWYSFSERPAPAPHLAHPEGCAALRIVLVTVPRVSRACEHFPDGFDHHLYGLLSRIAGSGFRAWSVTEGRDHASLRNENTQPPRTPLGLKA